MQSDYINKTKHVKIIGSGITGSLLALALSNKGFNVSIFDIKSPNELLKRDRIYALNHSSRKLLQEIGLWKDLIPSLTPFETLSISDQSISKSLIIRSNDLISINSKYKAIGWTIDNKIFMSYLIEKLTNSSNIKTNYKNSSDVDNQIYDYIFAADGIFSKSRNKLQISSYRHQYQQACITFKALLRVPYPDRAYEIFRNDGPLALLPMGLNKYQLILTAPIDKCKRLEKLPYSEFLDLIATYLPAEIEVDALITEPQTFPLTLLMSSKLINKGIYLVGETSHSVHPVAGQGLNLCLRDISDLLTLITLDCKNSSSISPFSHHSFISFKFSSLFS